MVNGDGQSQRSSYWTLMGECLGKTQVTALVILVLISSKQLVLLPRLFAMPSTHAANAGNRHIDI
jgi:hypothetical protein